MVDAIITSMPREIHPCENFNTNGVRAFNIILLKVTTSIHFPTRQKRKLKETRGINIMCSVARHDELRTQLIIHERANLLGRLIFNHIMQGSCKNS